MIIDHLLIDRKSAVSRIQKQETPSDLACWQTLI
jgi:hypothetical protein